jgi:excisionase family DNA binding protein
MNVSLVTTRDFYKRHGLRLRDYPDVLDVEQVSSILGVSIKTGYGLLKNGYIPYIKVGRSYRIPKTHLLAYLHGVELEK